VTGLAAPIPEVFPRDPILRTAGSVVTDHRDETELHRTLVELVGLLPEDESYEQTLQRIVELACQTIPGCDSASVTLTSGPADPGRTIVRTDGLAQRIDDFQYKQDSGPCLEAARTNDVVEVPSMSVEERWGPFPGEAIRHGVQCSMSIPLAVRAASIGALNLYSKTDRAYTETSREVGRLFGAQASVAVANAKVYEASRRLTEQMQEAMRSRAVIEQAKGILMAERGCDETVAFDLLRAASQRQNVKLRDVAQRLVDSKGNGVAH
jgi:GAF domain-containing protein